MPKLIFKQYNIINLKKGFNTMNNLELFQMALNIEKPWQVNDLKFDEENKRLDIYIDFKKGSTFSYEYIQFKKEKVKETIDNKEIEKEVKIEISRETFNDLKAYGNYSVLF
jgi:hypothetical protein